MKNYELMAELGKLPANADVTVFEDGGVREILFVSPSGFIHLGQEEPEHPLQAEQPDEVTSHED